MLHTRGHCARLAASRHYEIFAASRQLSRCSQDCVTARGTTCTITSIPVSGAQSKVVPSPFLADSPRQRPQHPGRTLSDLRTTSEGLSRWYQAAQVVDSGGVEPLVAPRSRKPWPLRGTARRKSATTPEVCRQTLAASRSAGRTVV